MMEIGGCDVCSPVLPERAAKGLVSDQAVAIMREDPAAGRGKSIGMGLRQWIHCTSASAAVACRTDGRGAQKRADDGRTEVPLAGYYQYPRYVPAVAAGEGSLLTVQSAWGAWAKDGSRRG